MDLEKIHITLSWPPFRWGATAMVVWRNRINVNTRFTQAYFRVIVQAIIRGNKHWPGRFWFDGTRGIQYDIEHDEKREKIRAVLEELWHLKQQKRFKTLIGYWWYSRKSIYAYSKAPNEKEAKDWANKMKLRSPKEVRELLSE